MSTKYIIVVGGVYSGSGKGVSTASLGLLLKMRDLKVTPVKFDPYLNVNAGILSPREHGEVFLCDDGSETDLDLGTYERIIGVEVSSKNILTAGQIYDELLAEQKEGKYLGQTVQLIPHVTNKIQDYLRKLGEGQDCVLVEIGGTVGDIESGPFLKAVRQFKHDNPEDVLIVHVAPILWVPTIKEFKTKPLQQSIELLQSYGMSPDILLCRCPGDRSLPPKILDKISNMTGVRRKNIFAAPDVKTLYHVPLEFYARDIDDVIIDRFRFGRNGVNIKKHKEVCEKMIAPELPVVKVGVLAKYIENPEEAYLSLKEALVHSAAAINARVSIDWISAEEVENCKRGVGKFFEDLHALIVPGGFDCRGVEGKIRGAKWAREHKLPFLGICLGLQCAVIEFARNVQGLDTANSIEFDPNTPNPVVHFVAGQEGLTEKSANMRLGAYDCELTKDSLAHSLYKKKVISERHRHRYEVNPAYLEQMAAKGFKVSGKNPQSGLVEIMELDQNIHPFYIGTQAHPEFRSRLMSPAPLFAGLMEAGLRVAALNTQPAELKEELQ
jgi:CTP synthase